MILKNYPKVIALVPIKEESQRLKNKNFLSFNGQPLYQVVLNTLENCPSVSEVIINTDSNEIARECSNLFSKVKIILRPTFLLGNDVTMNTIIDSDLSQINGEYFFQTHVTNPLLTINSIEKSINKYFSNLKTNDSLLSVNVIKKRVYTKTLEPINHKNNNLEQTQDLPEVLVENSNIFIFSRTSFYNNKKSRIGTSPLVFEMNEIESIDIDYENDFKLAELIYKNRNLFDEFS